MTYKLIAAAFMPHPPIMIPAVGGHNTGLVTDTIECARDIGRAVSEADIVVIIGPHGPIFNDAVTAWTFPYLVGNLGKFGHPEVELKLAVDEDLTDELVIAASNNKIPLAELGPQLVARYSLVPQIDHGGLVPLLHAWQEGFRGKIVYLNMGMLSYDKLYSLGQVVFDQCNDSTTGEKYRKVAVIASGDLSHCLSPQAPAGFNECGARFDKQVVKALAESDVRILQEMNGEFVQAAAECGLRPAYFLLGLLNSGNFSLQKINYEAPFGVGYATAYWLAK